METSYAIEALEKTCLVFSGPLMLKKGDRVFFCENSEESGVLSGNYAAEFYRIAGVDLGLFAIYYAGAGASTRHSSLDREIREDFYGSKAIFVYLGEPKVGGTHDDNWALMELRHALSRGVPCLIYISPTFPKEILKGHGIDGDPKVVNGKDDFCRALLSDLQALLNQ